MSFKKILSIWLYIFTRLYSFFPALIHMLHTFICNPPPPTHTHTHTTHTHTHTGLCRLLFATKRLQHSGKVLNRYTHTQHTHTHIHTHAKRYIQTILYWSARLFYVLHGHTILLNYNYIRCLVTCIIWFECLEQTDCLVSRTTLSVSCMAYQSN